MAKLDDLIEQMRSSPHNVRYADACTVADAFFGQPRQQGSSHRIWKMPWAGDPRVNMQESKGAKAKAYQVQQLLTALDRWRAEQSRKSADPVKTRAKDVGPKGKKGKKRS